MQFDSECGYCRSHCGSALCVCETHDHSFRATVTGIEPQSSSKHFTVGPEQPNTLGKMEKKKKHHKHKKHDSDRFPVSRTDTNLILTKEPDAALQHAKIHNPDLFNDFGQIGSSFLNAYNFNKKASPVSVPPDQRVKTLDLEEQPKFKDLSTRIKEAIQQATNMGPSGITPLQSSLVARAEGIFDSVPAEHYSPSTHGNPAVHYTHGSKTPHHHRTHSHRSPHVHKPKKPRVHHLHKPKVHKLRLHHNKVHKVKKPHVPKQHHVKAPKSHGRGERFQVHTHVPGAISASQILPNEMFQAKFVKEGLI